MPRQRRRRRRRPVPVNPADPSAARPILGRIVDRARWQPTLGVFTAFFAGLWIGGTLSLSDPTTAVALFGGAVGTAAGLARMLGNRLRARRLEQYRQRREGDYPPDASDGLSGTPEASA